MHHIIDIYIMIDNIYLYAPYNDYICIYLSTILSGYIIFCVHEIHFLDDLDLFFL